VSVERVSLHEVVERVVSCTMAAGCRHRLRVVHLDEVDVRGDAQRIGQILERLLDNARRFSPEGADIEIALVAREADGVVTVADHGVGIPPDQQARVFERFYRAHAGTPYDVGGMGIGLYISRQLVRQMGGELAFVSEEGRGSRFSASFPRWTA
jgi:signal transduction histidine kinase